MELVGERGYYATALADVADAVGVSKGAILHYYENKEALLVEAGIGYMVRRDLELAHAFPQLEDPLEQVGAVVYSTLMAQRDDRAASRVFGNEFLLFQRDPAMASVRRERDRYVQRVRAAIERCIGSGRMGCREVDLVVLEIFGVCNWSWTWYRPDGEMTAEEIAAHILQTLLSGLAGDRDDAIAADAGDRIVALIQEARAKHAEE